MWLIDEWGVVKFWEEVVVKLFFFLLIVVFKDELDWDK